MGLDQYLKAEMYFSAWEDNTDGKSHYVDILSIMGMKDTKACQTTPSLTVTVNVGYWRKANQIHKWFVDNIQDGVDNCSSYRVERTQLQELLKLCINILNTKGEKKMRQNAIKHLPTALGFFFGSTDVDSSYFSDLESTVHQLDQILHNTKFKKATFYYQSSW